MNSTTQCYKLIEHMKNIGPITSKEAQDVYGIARCASRMHDIKVMGYPVIRRIIGVKNRYDETVHVAEYSLPREIKNE